MDVTFCTVRLCTARVAHIYNTGIVYSTTKPTFISRQEESLSQRGYTAAKLLNIRLVIIITTMILFISRTSFPHFLSRSIHRVFLSNGRP